MFTLAQTSKSKSLTWQSWVCLPESLYIIEKIRSRMFTYTFLLVSFLFFNSTPPLHNLCSEHSSLSSMFTFRTYPIFFHYRTSSAPCNTIVNILHLNNIYLSSLFTSSNKSFFVNIFPIVILIYYQLIP